MPIDPSIALGVKPVKLESPVNQLAQLLQVQSAQQQNQLGQAKLDEYQRGVTRQNKLRDLVAGLPKDVTDDQRISAFRGGGYFDEADKLETSLLARQKTGAEVSKANAAADKDIYDTKIKQASQISQTMGALSSIPGVTPQYVASTIQHLGDIGLIPKEHVAGSLAQIPQDPAQLSAWLKEKQASSMTTSQQLEQQWKQKDYDLNVKNSDETTRHNRAGEANAAGTLAVAKGNLKVAQTREAREASAPRGQVVQTDAGTMLVDPRSGTAKQVTANGQPLQPNLKSLPAPIQKALLENDAALRKVDKALAAIKDYPDALGAANYLGDTIRQRTDPKGVDARALVADIGSLKIHDRSGAAVTASETPRLKPFIPAATDNVATVRKKLALFRQEYEGIQSDINSTYTREQGYKVPNTAPPAAPAGVPDDIAALLQKHGGK